VVLKNIYINKNFNDPQSATSHLIGFSLYSSPGAHEQVFKTSCLCQGEFAERPIFLDVGKNASQPVTSLTLFNNFSEGFSFLSSFLGC